MDELTESKQPARSRELLGAIGQWAARRPRRAKVVAGLLATAGLVAGASTPAFADNANTYLARTQTVGSTGCSVTVSTWQNTAAYPGVYAGVSCTKKHVISVYHELDYLTTSNTWYAYGDAGWYNLGTYSSAAHEVTWSTCNMQTYGELTWRAMAWVYIDGTTYGPYASKQGGWQECTTH